MTNVLNLLLLLEAEVLMSLLCEWRQTSEPR